MKSSTKIAVKHAAVIVFSFLVPLLPQLLANINFGEYTTIAQAVLALFGAIYVTLTHQPAPSLTINSTPVNVTTAQ